jgi:CBS domain-containing protein
MKVHEVAKAYDEILVVQPDERIARVAARLQVAERRLACICTIDRLLVGVVTPHDTRIGALSGNPEWGEWPVRTVMTAHPLTCGLHDDADRVLDLMQTHEVRHVPIVDDGHLLLGLVSLSDLLVRTRERARRDVDFLTAFVFG